MLFCHNTGKTGNNAIEMSKAFQDIAWFERCTDLNLLAYIVFAITFSKSSNKPEKLNKPQFTLLLSTLCT